MQPALIIALSLHILSSVFWAGTSFTLARTGGVGGEQLYRPQMGAAVIAVLSGGYLGHLVHAGGFGATEQVLAVGALAALLAAGVTGALGGRAARNLRKRTSEQDPAPVRVAPPPRPPAPLPAPAPRCHGVARFSL